MSIEQIVGQKITEVIGDISTHSITFITESGDRFLMEHQQDCCENVSLDRIDGDLQGLVGQFIASASESVDAVYDSCESGTETKFFIRTADDLFIFTWKGYSNGYYSEGVDFWKIGEKRWG